MKKFNEFIDNYFQKKRILKNKSGSNKTYFTRVKLSLCIIGFWLFQIILSPNYFYAAHGGV